MSKHYKVNAMTTGGHPEKYPGFGPEKDHFHPFINTNQYVIWTRLNDKRYISFSGIRKGDILHILKPRSNKEKVYYKGEVLSHLIIDDKYNFSKNTLQWDWDIINTNKEHIGKKEIKFIVYWIKQPYPTDELYIKIMNGYNPQTVKEIHLY